MGIYMTIGIFAIFFSIYALVLFLAPQIKAKIYNFCNDLDEEE